MTLTAQLKLLANGINPETGEVLGRRSLTRKPDVIRSLFGLIEELSALVEPSAKKTKSAQPPKQTQAQRRQQNISDGRAPKSNFPWSDVEKKQLEGFFRQIRNIEQTAEKFERSKLAVAVQLQKLGLISDDELEEIRESSRAVKA
jgi:hypothetical protein